MRLGPGGYLKNRKLRNGERLFCCRSVRAAKKIQDGRRFSYRTAYKTVCRGKRHTYWMAKQAAALPSQYHI